MRVLNYRFDKVLNSVIPIILFGLFINFINGSSALAAENESGGNAERAKNRPTIALALGGGGARGAAHVGVLKVLKENNLEPDIIVGNSMGAIVGGMYCAGVPIERLERLIRDGKVKKAFKPLPPSVQVFKKVFQFLKFWDRDDYPGFYSGKALEKFIEAEVPEGKNKIESSNPRFAATAVDLIDGKAYRLEKGELSKALRASASFPPLLKPVELEEHVFTDGGVRSNVPTFSARGMGADYVIAVNVDEKVDEIEKKEIRSYKKLINRLSSIIVYLRDKELLKHADLVIQPDVSGISIISVNEEDYERAFKAGEQATLQLLPEIRKAFNAPKRSVASKE